MLIGVYRYPLFGLNGFVFRNIILQGLHWGVGIREQVSGLGSTCIPKPYKIVGYDPVIGGSKPENGRLSGPKVTTRVQGTCRVYRWRCRVEGPGCRD